MGFTRKVLEKKSAQADYGAQLAYFELPHPMGVLGVNRDDLIDIDESGVWLCVCRRVRGHAPRGQSAATHSPYNEGKKYTVIMAIDTAGVLAYQLSDLPGHLPCLLSGGVRGVALHAPVVNTLQYSGKAKKTKCQIKGPLSKRLFS